jgi:hypothetical protein
VIERRGVRVGRRDALHRREVVHRARERAEVLGAVLRVADERLREEHLERFGQARIDLARALHRRADRRAGHELVEDRAHGEHARARVSGSERSLQLGREARAVLRVRRNDRELRLQPREAVGPGRDARRVHVDLLTAIMALFQVEAERNDDRDRLVQRELHALREALVDECPQ